jgi:hypothetical protein
MIGLLFIVDSGLAENAVECIARDTRRPDRISPRTVDFSHIAV